MEFIKCLISMCFFLSRFRYQDDSQAVKFVNLGIQIIGLQVIILNNRRFPKPAQDETFTAQGQRGRGSS